MFPRRRLHGGNRRLVTLPNCELQWRLDSVASRNFRLDLTTGMASSIVWGSATNREQSRSSLQADFPEPLGALRITHKMAAKALKTAWTSIAGKRLPLL